MEQFVKLTKITGRKIESDEKTATGVKPIYVRPWDIESFSQDEDGVTVVMFNNHECIHVTETPEKIYKMVSEEKKEKTNLNDPYKVVPYPVYYERSPYWWETQWWKNPTITCDTAKTIPEGTVHAWNTSDVFDFISRSTPNYSTTIFIMDGEVCE